MTQRRPNVIMILLDDMGYWTTGASGNQEIQTPHIDALTARGLSFSNCYCVSPVCSPARASLFTGKIPSQHGIQDWIRKGSVSSDEDRPIDYLAGHRSFTDALADNGYTCGLVGKWHMGNSYTPQFGFSHWTVTPKGSNNYYGAKLFRDGKEVVIERYLTDELTDEAIDFLSNQARSDAPFYLSLHYTAPHRPWNKEQHPPEFWNMYSGCDFASCPDLPTHPWQINNGIYPGEDRLEMLRGYCTALTAADAAIGRVLRELDQLGLRDDTLIILTSDNGMSLGHHGIHGKGNATYPQNMYDQAVKVPFVLSHLGRIALGASNALISHYDFYPTLLDYLGIDEQPVAPSPGRSFVGHVLGQESPGRENVVVFDEYGPVRMLRDQRWKYVLRLGDWDDELFDLLDDPGELTNLIHHPECKTIAEKLRQQLENWFEMYVDPKIDASKHKNFGRGQLAKINDDDHGASAFSDDWFYQLGGGVDPGQNL